MKNLDFLVNPQLENYLKDLITYPHPIFKEMERHYQSIGFPAVGPLVGQLLHFLVKTQKASQIFELGSGFGYSALWMAFALDTNGKIICTDKDIKNKKQAEEYFEKTGKSAYLDFRVGNALEILDKEDGPFDLIFCDINKEEYPNALEIALKKLKKGGLFVADNVLWYGRVYNEKFADESTKAIKQFNKMIFSKKEFVSTIIPLRDGVSISYKIK